MKTIAKPFAGMIVVFMLFLASSSVAQTTPHCTNETFQGRYAFQITGIAGGSFQTAFVFNIIADGHGVIPSGGGAQGFPGFIINNITLTGTYSVNADCSGQLTVTSNDGDVGIENFVLMDGGRRLVLIDDIPGDVLSGEGERISRNPETHCTNRLVRGTYSLKETGIEDGNALFSFVGKFTADGKGNGSNGSGTIADGPVIVNNLPFSVHFSVNADCSGTLALANVPPNFEAKTFNIAVLEDGKKLFLIDTDTDGDIESAVAQRLTGSDDSDEDR